jgi:hypothetical protein
MSSRESGAYPYFNYNAKIQAECYGANSMSWRLDSHGRITDIVNNYNYLSFNFGPTLLSWMKQNSPDTFRRIQEADRYSCRGGGLSGNAMAQAYNHMILPLADSLDRETQIIWGLRDFNNCFNRDSRGMWLPETAINNVIAADLVRLGVEHIILSPTQAEKVRKTGDTHWRDVSDNTIDPFRPYLLRTPHGDLKVFFYHMSLSAAISFNHLLTSSDALLHGIIEAFPTNHRGVPPVLLIATDGEVYGHHEVRGDMCLSALFSQALKGYDIDITNPGQYLDANSVTHEVLLKEGYRGEGTAWSCSHSLGRWSRDCGCSTDSRAGWNQKWRGPFRNSLDKLRDGLRKVFIASSSDLFEDPWQARNEFQRIFSVNEFSEKSDALAVLVKSRNRNSRGMVRALSLLESQRYAMYMYTSCGWFFSDVSRIEAVQNMRFAWRAVELVSDYCDISALWSSFLKDLETVESNVEEYGTGRRVLEKLCAPEIFDHARAAAFHFMNRCYPEVSTQDISGDHGGYLVETSGKTEPESSQAAGSLNPDNCNIQLSVMEKTTGRTRKYNCSLYEKRIDQNSAIAGSGWLFLDSSWGCRLKSAEEDVEKADFVSSGEICNLEILGRGNESFLFMNINSMPVNERALMVEGVFSRSLTQLRSLYRHIYADNRAMVETMLETGLPLPAEMVFPFKVSMEERVNHLIGQIGFTGAEKTSERVSEILGKCRSLGIEIDLSQLTNRVCETIGQEVANLDSANLTVSAVLMGLTEFAMRLGLGMRIEESVAKVFNTLVRSAANYEMKILNGHVEEVSYPDLVRLVMLAERMNINCSEFKERLNPFRSQSLSTGVDFNE